MSGRACRWCFTINNPTEEDKFWLNDQGEPSDLLSNIYYCILQEERGAEGTLHWQGFLILTQRQTFAWVKRRINKRAHWEVAKGTNEQARDYCRKEETYTGGLRYEYGHLPERTKAKKASERLEEAAEQLDILKEGYKRPTEIPSMTLMQCGFIPAMKELTADILGPYRKNLKIITLIGPPGCGKSYAIQHYFPGHGRCIAGNNGIWFQQPLADVMVFEEFCGQIPLQRMLQFLDPYPLALEIKGGMRPALYTTVVITSNTTPKYWYKAQDDSDPKRMDAIHALWDRINYSDGSYVPVRQTGYYLQAADMAEYMGQPADSYIRDMREFFWNKLAEIMGIDPIEASSESDRDD